MTTLTVSTPKYRPLTEFLRNHPRSLVRMSFAEIERVINATLPRSATTHRAWWSNNADNNVMTRAWKEAGFESEDVDMTNRQVTFRRVRPSSPDQRSAFAATPGDRHPLIGWMKGTLAAADGVDLTQPADPEWGAATGAGAAAGLDRRDK